jgi:adenylosuccinate synthase
MNTLAVVGTQWGDEGKGKATDFAASLADVVVRYQGGNNAGHTIKFNNQTFALHLIPSGIFRPNVINIMAQGMVINLKALVEEINMLKEKGVNSFNLEISSKAHMILPYHLELDELYEGLKENSVGTTKRGIGPAYADKMNREGIRMGMLLHLDALYKELNIVVTHHNQTLKSFNEPTFDLETLFEDIKTYAAVLAPYIKETDVTLNQYIEKDKKILFEGAQGTMLCIEHGTYPFVTSSSPTAASIPLYTGIRPKYIENVLGVVKAYTTRVGEGFFATEMMGETADHIREIGHEYGTSTGRARRIGWLDTVVLRHAARVNGLTGLSVMLLDVLSGIDELKICTHYMLNEEVIDFIPSYVKDYERVTPIFKTLKGWQEDITHITSYDELPQSAQAYLEELEELVGVPVQMISVGPDRTQTMVLKKLFK